MILLLKVTQLRQNLKARIVEGLCSTQRELATLHTATQRLHADIRREYADTGVDKEVGEGGMRFRQQSLIVLSLVCGPLNNSDYCFSLATGQATSGSIDAGKLCSAFAYVPVPRPPISESLDCCD